MTPQDRRLVIEHMLDALQAPKTPLTSWEEDFLDSITEQFAERHTLSDKQFEILDRIYADKTPL